MDKYLTAPQIKRAVYLLLKEYYTNLEIKDISFKKHKLYINGTCVLCYDRYLHYPDERDHGYAMYGLLCFVKEIMLKNEN